MQFHSRFASFFEWETTSLQKDFFLLFSHKKHRNTEKKKEVSKDPFLSYEDACVWHRYHEWIIVKNLEMQIFYQMFI